MWFEQEKLPSEAFNTLQSGDPRIVPFQILP